MKKGSYCISLILIFSIVPTIFASEEELPCNSEDGNYSYAQSLVTKRNLQDKKNTQSKIFSDKKFGISEINFGRLHYSTYGDTVEFGDWIVPFGGPMCYNISRKYEIKKITKIDYDNLITRIKTSKESNYYSSGGKLEDGFELFKTGSINGMPFLITSEVWGYDGSTNYELILQGGGSYYAFSGPHNNTLIDIALWKRLIKSIKFYSTK